MASEPGGGCCHHDDQHDKHDHPDTGARGPEAPAATESNPQVAAEAWHRPRARPGTTSMRNTPQLAHSEIDLVIDGAKVTPR